MLTGFPCQRSLYYHPDWEKSRGYFKESLFVKFVYIVYTIVDNLSTFGIELYTYPHFEPVLSTIFSSYPHLIYFYFNRLILYIFTSSSVYFSFFLHFIQNKPAKRQVHLKCFISDRLLLSHFLLPATASRKPVRH